jgi:hypothetical protein
MKKVLYISLKDRSSELSQFFEVFDHIETLAIEGMDRELIFNAVKHADIILVHHNRGLMDVDFWSRVNKKVIWWVNDERLPLPVWQLEFMPYIDLFLVSSLDIKRAIEAKGGKAQYLIMGINPKMMVDNDRPIDVCFTGQHSKDFPLSTFRRDMVRGLQKRVGKAFHVYGANWGKSNGERIGSGVYGMAKIGVNVGHYNTKGTYSNRVLQIMTNGAMCLAHNSKGLRDVFTDHIVYFEGIKDCVEKINYYLEHDNERIEIAKKGKHFVDNYLTWKDKGKTICELIHTI